MESGNILDNKNSENSKLIAFIPELKITYLKKVPEPKMTKSPSWPSSPSTVRSDTSQNYPPYLTLGRKGLLKKTSENGSFFESDSFREKRTSDSQLEEIRNMLSNLDLTKYLRKTKECSDQIQCPSLQRSVSVQPQVRGGYEKKSLLDHIPPPPKTKALLQKSISLSPKAGEFESFDASLSKSRLQSKSEQSVNRKENIETAANGSQFRRSSRSVNHKLKELTERLRSSSAPPSPHRKSRNFIPYTAPPTLDFSFWSENFSHESLPRSSNFPENADTYTHRNSSMTTEAFDDKNNLIKDLIIGSPFDETQKVSKECEIKAPVIKHYNLTESKDIISFSGNSTTLKRKEKNAPINAHTTLQNVTSYTPLPLFEKFKNEELQKIDLGTKIEEATSTNISHEFKDLSISSTKTRKETKRRTEYSTLPRAKVLHSDSINFRSLACLDLNIGNFQHKPKYEAQNDDGRQPISVQTADTYLSNKNKSLEHLEKRYFQENESEGRNKELKKQESFKNIAKSKGEAFDLNFSKYGSLSLGMGKKTERRKSLTKAENFDLSIAKDNVQKDSTQLSKTANKIKEGNKNCRSDGEMQQKNAINVDETPQINTNKAENLDEQAPNTKPLEEEIRAIAKLLDGKESMFLKLIQSSKLKDVVSENSGAYSRPLSPSTEQNEESNGNERCELPSEDSFNAKNSETTDHTEPLNLTLKKEKICLDRSFSPPVDKSAASFSTPDMSSTCTSGRDSPQRLRAHTVPGTESTNRTQCTTTSTVLQMLSSPPQQKRYFKKRLRGPYGEMLEQEMSKSMRKTRPSYVKDLDFLKELEENKDKFKSNVTCTKYFEDERKIKSDDETSTTTERQDLYSPKEMHAQGRNKGDITDRLETRLTTRSPRPKLLLRSSSHSLDETSHSISVDGRPKRKTSANIPTGANNEQDSLCIPTESSTHSEPTLHIRSHSDSVKTSSTWRMDTTIDDILKQTTFQDTRTHIVGELYETELSYVESLQIIIQKYMIPLKEGEHRDKIGAEMVDSIFQGVPDMLRFHEQFLDTLRERLRQWDTRQKIGDVFVEAFTHPSVLETYIEFINNWKSARDAIKSASVAKPAFAQFLEHTSREHKGKLSLDALLIMPVQRIPRYELLIKELLKHTPLDHPDYKLLLQAQREVHDLAVRINKVEREALHHEQRIQKLREVEQLVEGINDLTQGDRCFIRHDFVFIPGGLGLTKKERCLLLFSDLLLVASVKRKGGGGGAGGGVIARKTSPALAILPPTASLESNKYKLLMRLSLDNVDIIKTGIDEPCVRKFLKDISSLENDIATLCKIGDLSSTLSCPHQNIEDAVKDLQTTLTKQLSDKQASSSQLMSLELAFNINDEVENLLVSFPSPEQRMTWEAAFLEAKEKLNKCPEKSCPPEFLCSLPIRKTRAGLQITCTAAVCEDPKESGLPDLWVCSSDGYVGQVCILAFKEEPAIISCASVANARILCIASVPGLSEGSLMLRRRSTVVPCLPGFQLRRLSKGQESKTSKQLLDSDSDEEDFIDAAEDEFPSDNAGAQPPTMWLGTEDGCIYVYDSTHIQLTKAKLKIQHSTCIYDIVHVEGKVFVSLANGEIVVYSRELNGSWDSGSPHRVQIANDASPISRMVLIEGRLWCATLNSIVIINPTSIHIEHTFHAASEVRRHVTGICYASGLGVWVSIQASPSVHLYHVTSYDFLLDLDVTAPVTRMLSCKNKNVAEGYCQIHGNILPSNMQACDDIIRQHKLACLRVSSISVDAKGLLWIGTSAGVVLRFSRTILNTSSRTDPSVLSDIDSMPQGHFGHVRFICGINAQDFTPGSHEESGASAQLQASTSAQTSVTALMISGGDGYEEFGTFPTTSEVPTGREDSTNHLLMWKI